MNIPARTFDLLGAAVLSAVAPAALAFERIAPLRPRVEPGARRLALNVALGLSAAAVARLCVVPVMSRAARWSARRRFGLLHRLPLSGAARAALGFVVLDWTMYLWHRANHRVPALWRFHRVHHLDRDLDASTALRFHFGEIAMSVPFRAAQVALLGVSPVTAAVYEVALQTASMCHHSAVNLTAPLDRALRRVFVTPRMHGVHHSIDAREADANWSVVFSIWDRLHDTFVEREPDVITTGAPDEPVPPPRGFFSLLALPFRPRGEP